MLYLNQAIDLRYIANRSNIVSSVESQAIHRENCGLCWASDCFINLISENLPIDEKKKDGKK